MNLFKPLDPRLAAELKSQRKPIFLGLGSVAVTAMLTAGSIKLIELAFEALEAQDVQLVGVAALLIVAVYAVKYVFTRSATYFLSMAANRLSASLRERLFRKLMRLPVAYFNERRAGAIQSVFNNDVTVYQTAVTIVRDSIEGPIKALGALALVFWIQWKLALLAVFFLPFMAWAIQRNARKVRTAQAQVQADLSDLNASTNETIQGTRVVKAFSAEEAVEGSYREQVERTYLSQMGAVARIASLRPLVELIGAASLAVVLYAGGYLAAAGEMKIAQLMALLYALDVVMQGMRNLASVSNTYSQVQAAADRIYGEVLDVPEQHDAEWPDRVSQRRIRLPGRHPGSARRLVHDRTGYELGPRGTQRRRQEHTGRPAAAVLRPHRGRDSL
jgi:ABC-type multidrug transport system fused ATPase/permease subunit